VPPPFPRSILGMIRTIALALFGALAVGFVVAWRVPPVEAEFYRDRTDREAHVHRIRGGPLADTRLGRAWLESGRRALDSPLPVSWAHLEEGRFVQEGATALGFRVPLSRGQRLEVEVGGGLWKEGRLFLDLFRIPPDSAPGDRPVRLASEAGGSEPLVWEAESDQELVVRLQPPLITGGRYRIRMRRRAILEFPVAGRDQSSVLSVFGAPREAGRREHHGVDIFAPRGTPVVAASAGVVRRANETPLGGRVIWLRDRERRQTYYYAHLDRQGVRAGQGVAVGDTIGWVGNTGNARTTPPHLHFGIYRRGRGPIDPLPYIRVVGSEPAPILADPAVAGGWVTPQGDGVRVRAAPSTAASIVTFVDEGRALRVLGVTGEWFRVHLPDGSHGFLARRVASPDVAVAQE